MSLSRSQIIATIGPATRDEKLLREMIVVGMDAARLNFSHGTHEEHAAYIKAIRAAAKEAGKRVPIIQDLSGPREIGGGGHHIAENPAEIFTSKDRDDLAFGLAQGVDYIAMSYVGNAADVAAVRQAIGDKKTPIIAKIERSIAVENIEEIVAAADAIMIGRGDLGNEVPLEEIPFIERNIILRCKVARKPVIVATQMMTSMMEHETPSRADVTDVCYAILSGADAVMLSEETAIGTHPFEVIKMMERVVKAAEKHLGRVTVNSL